MFCSYRLSKRNQHGTLAEFAPALAIAIFVLLMAGGFAFYLCGVSTAYFACQVASREAATGGSRNQIAELAANVADKVGAGSFGQLCNLEAKGGGPLSKALTVSFFEVTPATGVAVELPARAAIDKSKMYQLRVESTYQVTIPFIGKVDGHAACENLVDHPEALAN